MRSEARFTSSRWRAICERPVRRVVELARKSLRKSGPVFLAVCFSKLVQVLIGAHYNPLVEVLMDTCCHIGALALLHMSITPSSVGSLRVAAEAFLR